MASLSVILCLVSDEQCSPSLLSPSLSIFDILEILVWCFNIYCQQIEEDDMVYKMLSQNGFFWSSSDLYHCGGSWWRCSEPSVLLLVCVLSSRAAV